MVSSLDESFAAKWHLAVSAVVNCILTAVDAKGEKTAAHGASDAEHDDTRYPLCD